MKKYHIVYKEKEEDYYSKGVSVEGTTPLDALHNFYDNTLISGPPDDKVIFLCMHTLDIEFIATKSTEPPKE